MNKTVEQLQEVDYLVNAITHMEGEFTQEVIDFTCECILKAQGNIILTIQALSVDANLPPELVAAIVG
jgi:hypothetical protein